jgi:hypothetical protein
LECNRITSARTETVHYETNFDGSIPISKRKVIINKRISNEFSTKTQSSTENQPYLEMNNTGGSASTDHQPRKGSLESLASLQSYESQVSVESSESQHSHDNNKPIPSTRSRRAGASSSSVEQQSSLQTPTSTTMSRRTDSSSTGYSDGETDAETPSAIHSAPPVFNTSMPSFSTPRDVKYHQTSVNVSHSPSSDIWRKRPDYNAPEYPLQVPQKPTITRSANVTQHRNLNEALVEQERLNRFERLNKGANTTTKLDNLARREQRRLSDNDNTVSVSASSIRDQNYGKELKDYSYLRRQNSEGDASLADITPTVQKVIGPQKEKIEPDVPVRSARRNRPSRELQCRSMGESVNEATTEARNVLLGTIKESDLVKTNVWPHKDEVKHDSSRGVADWPVNKKDPHFKPQAAGIKRVRSNAISTMELRRRNSDPATKVSGLSEDKSHTETCPNDLNPAWKGNQFSLAGHQFRKIARFSKDDVCVCCNEKMDAFVTQVSYTCHFLLREAGLI